MENFVHAWIESHDHLLQILLFYDATFHLNVEYVPVGLRDLEVEVGYSSINPICFPAPMSTGCIFNQ